MKSMASQKLSLPIVLLGMVWTYPQQFTLAAQVTESSPQVDFYSIIEITFAKNLQIAAARYEIEASDYQFRRFERNLSQFVPLIVEATADRNSQSGLDDGHRLWENDDEAAVSAGFEKEFFDGKQISAGAGVRGSSDDSGENSHPFVGGEILFPLFSSFTTLERVTERNFEENELLNAWLDFIDTVRESISESHEAYVDVEEALGMRLLSEAAIRDYQSLLNSSFLIARENDRLRVEDQIQAFQSESVDFHGEVDSALISLLETLGLDTVELDAIRHLEMNAGKYYGSQYIDTDLDALIQDAIENDVEIRVLKIAQSNAELKKRLAKQGKWDIFGKLFGNYDFARRGDDRRKREGYEVGLGISIQRNDPKLLLLSMRQAEAEIRQFNAQILWRERQVEHLIKRRVSEARTLRQLIDELKASRTLRHSVYTQKHQSFLSGQETIDNLIQTRESLFETETELVERLAKFFEIVIELDVASGFYFKHLGDLVSEIEGAYGFNQSRDSNP
jgi:outer membrane protein TolC